MHTANSWRAVLPALLFSLGVCGLLMAGGPRNKDPIPNDLKIVPQYYAG
jgi:hypothetical protein